MTGSNHEVSGKEINLNNAIFEWRLKLRQTGYLTVEKHGSVLTSITADILDQGLLQFTTEADRKRGYRMLDVILHQDPPTDPSLHQPVFVLPSERQKFSTIEALAQADIDNMILDIIESLGDE